MTLGELNDRMLKLAATVEGAGPESVRRMAMRVLTGVVMGTPVGNPALWKFPAPPGYVGGRARANWFISSGGPHTQPTNEIDASGSNTIARGSADIASFSGGTLYLTNNVPYIVLLNNGWSKQAPIGWIEQVLNNARDKLKTESVLNFALGQTKKLL